MLQHATASAVWARKGAPHLATCPSESDYRQGRAPFFAVIIPFRFCSSYFHHVPRVLPFVHAYDNVSRLCLSSTRMSMSRALPFVHAYVSVSRLCLSSTRICSRCLASLPFVHAYVNVWSRRKLFRYLCRSSRYPTPSAVRAYQFCLPSADRRRHLRRLRSLSVTCPTLFEDAARTTPAPLSELRSGVGS